VCGRIGEDHLGSPRAITDQSGKTVWRWDQQEAFGLNAAQEDPDGDGKRVSFNLRFAGQYYDQESGLHYNRLRDYDPVAGRYIQADPIGLGGGVSLYAYVSGNPLSFIDPLGLAKCDSSNQSTVVIGRMADLKSLGGEEFSLTDRLPYRGNAKLDWRQNAGVLRAEMRQGRPIRDASPGDEEGQFLNAERLLLKSRGWTPNANATYWMPPRP
jgi:RHS repeat-associated protein